MEELTSREGFLRQESKAFTSYSAVFQLTESQSIGGDNEIVGGERRVRRRGSRALDAFGHESKFIERRLEKMKARERADMG